MEGGCLAETRVQVPESQAAKRVAGTVASVGGDVDGAKFGGSCVRIGKQVEAGALRSAGAGGPIAGRTEAVSTAANIAVGSGTEGSYADKRNGAQTILKEPAAQVTVGDRERWSAGSTENA